MFKDVARLIGLTVVVAAAFFAAFAENGAENGGQEQTYTAAQALIDEDEFRQRYVRVTKSKAPIYERLDPRSNVVRLGRSGEYLDLLAAGELWFKVRVDNRPGYMQTRDGVISEEKGGTPYGRMILIVVVLMAGCVGCVFLFIKKNQAAAA